MSVTRKLPACPHCGYWLRAFEGQVCPECGRPIDWDLAKIGTQLTPRGLATKWGALGIVSGALSAVTCLPGLFTFEADSGVLALLCIVGAYFGPGLVFGIVVVRRMLQVRPRSVLPTTIHAVLIAIAAYFFACAALIACIGVCAVIGLSMMAPAAGLAGAIGAFSIEYFAFPNRTARHICADLNVQFPWERSVIGATVGAAATSLPALLATRGTSSFDFFGNDDSMLILLLFTTFIAWQAGVAAVFGYFTAELNPLATAAPGSRHSPSD